MRTRATSANVRQSHCSVHHLSVADNRWSVKAGSCAEECQAMLSQIVKIPTHKGCLKGNLSTEQFSDHEPLATQEVDGIGSIRSFERPFHDDLLGQGDLELVAMTYCHTRNGSVHPARSNAHSLATWGHSGSWGDPAETVRVLISREGLLQQRCVLALQRPGTGRYGHPTAELVLTLLLLAYEVDSFRSN